jgi:murein DD-endopeptidase MepM/ murein hydrolase activator NlpD
MPQSPSDLPVIAPPSGSSRSHSRRAVYLIGVTLVLLFAALGGYGLLPVAAPPTPPPTAEPTKLASGGSNVELTPAATPGQTPSSTVRPGPTPTPEPSATPDGPTSPEPEALTGFVWPLRNGRLSSPFGARSDGLVMIDGERAHDGIDLASWCGDKIRAAHDGVVLHAGRKFDEFSGFSDSLEPFYQRLDRIGGLKLLPITVVIDYGNGYNGLYAHLAKANVVEGEAVVAGQVIGLEGATGRATGCHLHYSIIRMDGAWMDIAPNLVDSLRYPAQVRERIDPLLVLPIPDWDAPRKFQPTPEPTPSPSPTPDPAIDLAPR